METVLVTGGAGFIGSHVVDELIHAGYQCVVLDDLSGGFVENVNPKAEFIHGSITDAALIKKIFHDHKITYVFHLAAYAAEGLSHFIRHFNYENNLIGSVNLINASVNHNVKCFVFTSSIAVYGKNQLPMTEDIQPAPEDPYGVAKLAVEQDLRAAHEMFGLDYIIFRPHNVYGERQNLGDKYRNVVGIFMNQIMQGQPLSVFGDGEQTRAFSYIGDVAPVIAQSIRNPKARNQVFNVGADEPFTVNHLAKEVARAMGVPENYPKVHNPPRKEVVHAYSSHDKARDLLGCVPKTTLAEGLKKMSVWAKKTGIKASKEFSNIEIPKNLPPSWTHVSAKQQ